MTRIMELMAPDIYGRARVQYTSPLTGLALAESRQGRQGPYCCRRLLETAARPLSYSSYRGVHSYGIYHPLTAYKTTSPCTVNTSQVYGGR
jgi:hypothetical protein